MKRWVLVLALASSPLTAAEGRNACYAECAQSVKDCSAACRKVAKKQGGDVKFCDGQCRLIQKPCEKECDKNASGKR